MISSNGYKTGLFREGTAQENHPQPKACPIPYYPEAVFDADILLAGVFLHDVSKLLEIEKGPDGKTGFSDLTEKMPHAVYGAFMALKADLPLDVINMILAHTRHTGAKPACSETVVLHYLDYLLADVLRFQRSLSLILEGKGRYGR